MDNNRGFTLIEILMSLALISILAGAFFFAFENYQLFNDSEVTAVLVAQSLRRAQLFSEAMKDDDNWGVKILPDKVVVFKGDSYTGPDDSFDETVDFPAPITVTGLSEIIFNKFSGNPQSVGTITLTVTSGLSREIELQAKGRIIY